MATPLRTVSGSLGDPLAEAIELTRRLKLPYIRRALTTCSPPPRPNAGIPPRWSVSCSPRKQPALRLRAVGHREEPLHRGPRAGCGRGRGDGRLVRDRRPRGLVRRHRVDDSLARAMTRLMRSDLIIVDDIGLLPVFADAAEGFFRLVDAAYERRAMAVSSNLHPSGFDEIMPKTLATATVDRLLHHAHVVVTQGDSFRLPEATPPERGSGP